MCVCVCVCLPLALSLFLSLIRSCFRGHCVQVCVTLHLQYQNFSIIMTTCCLTCKETLNDPGPLSLSVPRKQAKKLKD